MSELSTLIFHGAEVKITSSFGARSVIKTSKGETAAYHSAVDYGTYGKKLPQYAIADGEVLSCGKDDAYGGALFVWVKYPQLGVKMLHYHLDRYTVKKGEKVTQSTIIGYTGMTGKATGIHLHLGLKRLSGGGYIDPEKWAKEELPALLKKAEASKKPEGQYKKGNYKVNTAVLNVRTEPSLQGKIKPFSALTQNAQKKIKALAGKAVNGYVQGLEFTALEIKNNWGRSPSGWVCLDWCKKI